MADDSHAVGASAPAVASPRSTTASSSGSTSSPARSGRRSAAPAAAICRVQREIVELLCQRARPYLFSTASRLPSWRLACALDLTEGSPDLRNRLRENTAHFRSRLVELGFDVLPGDHPIVPVMIGNEVAAARFAAKLQELGAYAVSVSDAVVPRVTARIRTQMSAAHTRDDLHFAADRFTEARDAARPDE